MQGVLDPAVIRHRHKKRLLVWMQRRVWHQRGPVAESSQIRLPARDGVILIKRCSMNVCHILSKDEVCTINARRRESWAFFPSPALAKNTVPRLTQEFGAHHLDLSLRSCSCAADQIFCFSQHHAVKAEPLYVDAAFHTGGGLASSANALTCEVWHGCVVACSVTVQRKTVHGI